MNRERHCLFSRNFLEHQVVLVDVESTSTTFVASVINQSSGQVRLVNCDVTLHLNGQVLHADQTEIVVPVTHLLECARLSGAL